MKQKINITFEVKTTIEVDIPEGFESLGDYVLNNKNAIAAAAREKVLEEGINQKLSWDNLYWSNPDGTEIDMSDVLFEI